jgi:hypothetical protein
VPLHRSLVPAMALAVAWTLAACSSSSPAPSTLRSFSLDGNAGGLVETVDNVSNLTVVSRDPSDLRAEYRAGFVQGKLQATGIVAARDNTWDNAYQVDPGHNFPRQPGPTAAERERAAAILRTNYDATLSYVRGGADADAAAKLGRLVFRMLGIYHGATRATPEELDLSGGWLPDATYLTPAELSLGYETAAPTFLDVYWINAFNDLM